VVELNEMFSTPLPIDKIISWVINILISPPCLPLCLSVDEAYCFKIILLSQILNV